MASLVKPNLPQGRRLPKTFLVVLFLFLLWAALMLVGFLNPSALYQPLLIAQQIAGWVFVITVAVVGSLLLGMFISHRLLTHGGFTPFEEEMMRMRKDVQQQLNHTQKMHEEVSLMRLEVARLKAASRQGADREGDLEPGVRSKRGGTQGELAVAASSAAGEGAEGLDDLGR